MSVYARALDYATLFFQDFPFGAMIHTAAARKSHSDMVN